MSAQATRDHLLNLSCSADQRILMTAGECRTPQNLFTPEEMQNIKLNSLRTRRRQLQQKLKMAANRINYKRKKQQEELKRFIRSEQKSIVVMEKHKYKKHNEMLKEEFEQRKTFEIRKKSKEVSNARSTSNGRMSLIYQAMRDRKQEEGQRMRNTKKMDEQAIRQQRETAHLRRCSQHQMINKMKQRQSIKKRCYWYEKRLSFQKKLLQDAQIYQKKIEEYCKKIEDMRQNQSQLKKQEEEARKILQSAQENYRLLEQS